ncbi:MAG TPA: hypothetical protein PKL99_03625, partial [Syntrophales bacterium]|nr:hypothetical protein [Syntrophales bacterium]
YVHSKLKSRFCNIAVIPAWLLWVTVTAALVWFMAVVLPGNIAKAPAQGWTVMAISVIMLIMNFIFITDFVRKYRQEMGSSE